MELVLWLLGWPVVVSVTRYLNLLRFPDLPRDNRYHGLDSLLCFAVYAFVAWHLWR